MIFSELFRSNNAWVNIKIKNIINWLYYIAAITGYLPSLANLIHRKSAESCLLLHFGENEPVLSLLHFHYSSPKPESEWDVESIVK